MLTYCILQNSWIRIKYEQQYAGFTIRDKNFHQLPMDKSYSSADEGTAHGKMVLSALAILNEYIIYEFSSNLFANDVNY